MSPLRLCPLLTPWQKHVCAVLRQCKTFALATTVLKRPLGQIVEEALTIWKRLCTEGVDPLRFIRRYFPCELWTPRAPQLWGIQMQFPKHPGLAPQALPRKLTGILTGLHHGHTCVESAKQGGCNADTVARRRQWLRRLLGEAVYTLFFEEGLQRRFIRRAEHWVSTPLPDAPVWPFLGLYHGVCDQGHDVVTQHEGLLIPVGTAPVQESRTRTQAWACIFCWLLHTAAGYLLPAPTLPSPPHRNALVLHISPTFRERLIAEGSRPEMFRLGFIPATLSCGA